MDITPQDSTTTQPISDDQDLAKALAGVLPDDPTNTDPQASGLAPNPLQFEETPAPGVVASEPATVTSLESPSPAPAPAVNLGAFGTQPAETGSTPLDLSSVKTSALNELRPLIGKVDLPPEEKFDTYLMLIRSTDDSSLIEPAHAAAQGISDEKRKAEALLDIIKEIDYLSRKDSDPAV